MARQVVASINKHGYESEKKDRSLETFLWLTSHFVQYSQLKKGDGENDEWRKAR